MGRFSKRKSNKLHNNYIKGKLPAVLHDLLRATVICLIIHFVFNRSYRAIFCLTTSSVSARSSAAFYSSRAVVFRRTTFNHSGSARSRA